MSEPILKLEGLKKHFNTTTGGAFNKQKAVLKAVDGIDLEVAAGETIGLVGESGCGKTTAGRTILKLYEPTEGKIIFEGEDISKLSQAKMKPYRRQMQMIFQDPYGSLNPRMTVADIIGEALDIHRLAPAAADRRARIESLLKDVGLDASHAERYPHEFSGGQRQRIAIAQRRICTALDGIANLQVERSHNIALLAIGVDDQCNTRGPSGVSARSNPSPAAEVSSRNACAPRRLDCPGLFPAGHFPRGRRCARARRAAARGRGSRPRGS